MKTFLVGIWVLLVSLGSSFAVATLGANGGGAQASADKPALTLEKTRVLNVPIIAGVTFTGFPVGTAASVLSLGTNVLATSLVGYKAWCVTTSSPPPHTPHISLIRPGTYLLRQSRKRIRGYFVGGSVASQVEKLFSLLIESGAIYSALWASCLL